jgi:hypothetical protein
MVQLAPFSNSKRKGKAGGASGGSRCVDSTVLFRGKANPVFSVILSRQTPSFSGFAAFLAPCLSFLLLKKKKTFYSSPKLRVV